MRTIGAFFGAVTMLLAFVGHADEGTIKVTSSAFENGGKIPSEYTCEGKGVAPPLSWSSVPPNTKSIAVLVEDPDAPGGTFEHFAAFNLPPDRKSLPSEAIRSIAPGSALMTAKNSSGTIGFAPICPPNGRHHYRFSVLALDQPLDLPPAASVQSVRSATDGHVLARGELVGIYGKR